MPNFVDFSQFAAANAGSEQELLQRALQRAEQATAKEKQALVKSKQEARGHYGADGQYTGEAEGLSQTVSYSDYLKASREAASAWAAVTARSADPRTAALQGSMGGDAGARAAAAGTESGQRLDAAGAEVEAGRKSQLSQRDARAKYAKEQADAAKARADRDAGAKEAYRNSLAAGAKARAAAGGAQLDYVGGYNPYASSNWAQQQGAFEAQQLKNAGGSDEQQRGIWNAYTGKGSQGSTGSRPRTGTGPWNPYDSMEREMQPFAPPDEED